MATPNYGNQMQPGMQPMQQQQQQMQPPGMNIGPPQGAVPPPKAVRRGTSKAVPVVMSAGLAVGVFCGLLFGLGTGNDGALASPGGTTPSAHSSSDSKDTKDNGDVADVLKTPTAADGTAKKIEATAPQPPPPAVPAAGSAGSAAGSAAPDVVAAPAATGSGAGMAVAATGSAAGSAAVVAAPTPAPAPGLVGAAKIKVEVTPATVTDAKITVDGKDLTPDMAIALGGATKKSVTVVVHATGYHEYEQKVEVTPGDTIVKVELVKRPTATASGGNTGGNSGGGNARPTWTGTQTVQPGQKKDPTPPKTNPTPPPKKTGGKSTGLIDI